MGLCRCVCGVCACLLAVPLLLICSVCIPEVELAYIRFVETYAISIPPLRLILLILGQVPRVWEHGPLGVGPVWNPRIVYAVNGYETGILPFPNPANFTRGYMLARVSHEQVRAVHHNPHLKRDAKRFIGVETAKVPKGYFSEGVLPTLLQMNTDDPLRYAHRDLLSAAMPSIAEYVDSVPEFKPLPDISPKDLVQDISWHLKIPFPKTVSTMVQNLFAFTFYRHAFGVELSNDELPLLREWLGIPGKLFLGMVSEAGAKHCRELAKVFEDKVAASEFGQRFMQEAERRGMNGIERLRKTVFEFSFAGFGGDGPGGALATMKMLRFIQKSPAKYVPLFQRDPEAFVLEVIRMQGGGGAGVNPWILEATQTFTLGTGNEVTEFAGNYGATIALHANHDPAVFGGPSADQQYAMSFIPGRENADRLLSFVGELREIRKCPNMTGCDAAPRFCLGTFMLPLGNLQFVYSAQSRSTVELSLDVLDMVTGSRREWFPPPAGPTMAFPKARDRTVGLSIGRTVDRLKAKERAHLGPRPGLTYGPCTERTVERTVNVLFQTQALPPATAAALAKVGIIDFEVRVARHSERPMELTIVKWVADDVRKTWAAGAVQHGSVQAAQVPQVPPASNQFNLTSPSVEVSDEDDMEMLPEDYVLLLERTPIWELPDDDDLEAEETESGHKKMRMDSPSSASTAATSPAAPSSPCILPSPHEPEFYAAMTEEEIRERLGVAGSNIAMEWEREDLLATLMEIDKVIPEMSKLGLST
ncbi:unnamed protein product [Durusdinium trenchii]|uniref:Uncharacterized protein n=2 Tax=Durusdinium trenchii TaxID=1381693 RepID=A0ABP0R8S0_9DINO